MHLPIKNNEHERHQYKLLHQARAVAALIEQHHYTKVVEMGCGLGFNTIYLARLFPQVQFLAMDITAANVAAARIMAKDLPNVRFQCFDYNTDEHTYQADVIFGVETFCYASHFDILIKNLAQALLPGGRLVIFDGYETQPDLLKDLNQEAQTAYRLVCRGFALERFQSIDEVYQAFQSNHLLLEHDSDHTAGILPNYKAFQQACLRLLSHPHISNILFTLGFLPKAIIRQLPSGLFGPYFFEQGHLSYRQLIVSKA